MFSFSNVNWIICITLTVSFMPQAFASESSCAGEAFMRAKVATVETDSLTYCKAYVDHTSIERYLSKVKCPLSIELVVNDGISFPLENGHDCNVWPGDVIDGLLKLHPTSGKVTL